MHLRSYNLRLPNPKPSADICEASEIRRLQRFKKSLKISKSTSRKVLIEIFNSKDRKIKRGNGSLKKVVVEDVSKRIFECIAFKPALKWKLVKRINFDKKAYKKIQSVRMCFSLQMLGDVRILPLA